MPVTHLPQADAGPVAADDRHEHHRTQDPGHRPGSDVIPTENAEHFRAGVLLFNRGRHWHAHEEWEICWLNEKDDRYKAFIQVAAALVKLAAGNLRGFQRNWAKAERRLADLPSHWNGYDCAAVGQVMRALAADPAGAAWPLLLDQGPPGELD